MALDALSLTVQELMKYQGPRKLSLGLRLVFAYYIQCYMPLPVCMKSDFCHFQLKQRKRHWCNLDGAGWLSAQTHFKKLVVSLPLY